MPPTNPQTLPEPTAFPVSDAQSAAPGTVDELKSMARGMSLRDYLAAKAMQGLLANAGGPIQANSMQGWGLVNCADKDIAAVAYRMADAMLKARNP